MDWYWISTTVVGAILSLLGGIMKYFHIRLGNVENKLSDTRENYVQKTELKDLSTQVDKRFDRLEELIMYRVKKQE